MFFFINHIFFNALEQFDILSWSGFFFKDIIFITNFLTFILGYFLIIWNYFNFFSKTIFLNSPAQIKINLLLFIIKLLKENLNMQKKIFLPKFFFVFIFLLISNIAGMIPYTLTLTSYFIITSFFSWGLFLCINIIACWINKWKFFSLFLPAGSPFPIIPLLIIIEKISYWARVISLAIRLFANMMSGHSLLKILTNFTLQFLVQIIIYEIFFWIPEVIVIIITLLEYVIAFLQAYVFINLAIIYLNDGVILH